MAETHDTIKSLLAEFRGYAAGMPPSYHVTMSWHDFRVMLNRFEAAHDHDVETATEASARAVVGACVKQQEAERKYVALREALELCVKGMCGYCRMDAEARGMTTECVNGCEALLMAKAALAAPPRNCDVGTEGEQVKRFTIFCKSQRLHSPGHADFCNPKCPCRDGGDINLCALTWAQMPYKEGGAK